MLRIDIDVSTPIVTSNLSIYPNPDSLSFLSGGTGIERMELFMDIFFCRLKAFNKLY